MVRERRSRQQGGFPEVAIALEATGIRCGAPEHADGRPVVLLLRAVEPPVVERVRSLARVDRRRVMAIACGRVLTAAERWTALEAGAADLIDWDANRNPGTGGGEDRAMGRGGEPAEVVRGPRTDRWAESGAAGCKFAEILAVQEEIARQVSDKLRLRPTGEEQKRMGKRATENTEAYQLYLKAATTGTAGPRTC